MRKKVEAEHEKVVEEKKHHEKVNHPGSKDQLEEVWKEEDHLEEEKFDPHTFFQLRGYSKKELKKKQILKNKFIIISCFSDMDGNGYLDEFEIEAMFQHEVN